MMRQIRSHIVQLFIISLLWVGFGLYIAHPAQAKSSAHSFADWFTNVTQKTDIADFADELNRLKDSGVKLSDLIEHASYLISKNDKDFNLPLKGASASHQIYQVLLAQWSQFQTGNGMANMPPPEAVKSGLNMQVEKSGMLGYGDVPGAPVARYLYLATWNSVECNFLDRSLTPMAAGIAIGAP